ncbi:MAG TPA: DUF3786 domain-containing protein [Dehalococcoidia bacterium]|nr:DUF3786 domain-containing protein [Dehalococcoidia bacterium]
MMAIKRKASADLMENRALSSSEVKDYEYGYGLAYKLASEQLARLDNIEQQCRRCGAVCEVIDGKTVITLAYLSQPYQVILPDIEIVLKDSQEGIPLRDKILILHYLTQARGTPPSGRMIAYKELPEGAVYFPTFFKRAIKPITDHFGSEPQRLPDFAAMLGGQRVPYGDVAVTINAFSRVPITFVLWRGDEEFAPEGNILFDSNIADYLTTEDINVLCETIAWRLVKALKAGGDKP